jgi:hypothetical protein
MAAGLVRGVVTRLVTGRGTGHAPQAPCPSKTPKREMSSVPRSEMAMKESWGGAGGRVRRGGGEGREGTGLRSQDTVG